MPDDARAHDAATASLIGGRDDPAYQPLEGRWAAMQADPRRWAEHLDNLHDRVSRLDPWVQAFVEYRPPPQGPPAPATVTYKDTIDIAGWATRLGLRDGFRHYPARSAHIVEQLQDQGLPTLGKVATTELNIGSRSPCVNPLYPHLSPAGSSTGSAVAVAAGLCDLSIGTDVVGSIRYPATHCGTVGLRLTPSHTLTQGIFPLAPEMDTVGLTTRTVHDLAFLWKACNLHQLTHSHPITPLRRRLRIGILTITADDQISHRLAHLADQLSHHADLIPVELDWDQARRHAWTLAAYHAHHIINTFQTATNTTLSPDVKAAAAIGTDLTAADHQQLLATQRDIKRNAAATFATTKLDVLLLPADDTLPSAVNQTASGPTIPRLDSDDHRLGWMGLASYARLPALTLPIGHATKRRPISAQLIAPAGCEGNLITAALLTETACK